jgi:hypothetical protein
LVGILTVNAVTAIWFLQLTCGPYFLGVQKTDFPGDVLDSGTDSFDGRFDFIFWHAKSFRPVPQLMLRMDVDTCWLG